MSHNALQCFWKCLLNHFLTSLTMAIQPIILTFFPINGSGHHLSSRSFKNPKRYEAVFSNQNIQTSLKISQSYGSVPFLSLAHIFQQSLDTSFLPNDRKIGKVIFLYKSGNKRSSINYRPILLASV